MIAFFLAFVIAASWMFKGVEKYYPEFTPQAWNKPGKRSLLKFEMPNPVLPVGKTISNMLLNLYNKASTQSRGMANQSMPKFSGTP